MFKSLWVRQTTKRFRAVEAVLSGESNLRINSDLPDGKERYLVVDYVPDISEAGEVLGFFVICQDLTEHKRTEEALGSRVGATGGDDASASPTLRQVQERTAQLQQALNFEVILKRITDKVRDSLDEGQILQTAVQELACLSINHCDTALYNPTRLPPLFAMNTLPLLPHSFAVVSMADFLRSLISF